MRFRKYAINNFWTAHTMCTLCHILFGVCGGESDGCSALPLRLLYNDTGISQMFKLFLLTPIVVVAFVLNVVSAACLFVGDILKMYFNLYYLVLLRGTRIVIWRWAFILGGRWGHWWILVSRWAAIPMPGDRRKRK